MKFKCATGHQDILDVIVPYIEDGNYMSCIRSGNIDRLLVREFYNILREDIKAEQYQRCFEDDISLWHRDDGFMLFVEKHLSDRMQVLTSMDNIPSNFSPYNIRNPEYQTLCWILGQSLVFWTPTLGMTFLPRSHIIGISADGSDVNILRDDRAAITICADTALFMNILTQKTWG